MCNAYMPHRALLFLVHMHYELHIFVGVSILNIDKNHNTKKKSKMENVNVCAYRPKGILFSHSLVPSVNNTMEIVHGPFLFDLV